MNSYTVDSFILDESLEVKSVKTVLDATASKSGENLENVLITYMEKYKIVYNLTHIIYQRLNHINYHYEIKIRNPKKTKTKVLIRLWLGPLKNEVDAG